MHHIQCTCTCTMYMYNTVSTCTCTYTCTKLHVWWQVGWYMYMYILPYLTSLTVAKEMVFLWYRLLCPWVKWSDLRILLRRRLQYILCEYVCVCVQERERESVCARERERERVCVCVCARKRERERERERERGVFALVVNLIVAPSGLGTSSSSWRLWVQSYNFHGIRTHTYTAGSLHVSIHVDFGPLWSGEGLREAS